MRRASLLVVSLAVLCALPAAACSPGRDTVPAEAGPAAARRHVERTGRALAGRDYRFRYQLTLAPEGSYEVEGVVDGRREQLQVAPRDAAAVRQLDSLVPVEFRRSGGRWHRRVPDGSPDAARGLWATVSAPLPGVVDVRAIADEVGRVRSAQDLGESVLDGESYRHFGARSAAAARAVLDGGGDGQLDVYTTADGRPRQVELHATGGSAAATLRLDVVQWGIDQQVAAPPANQIARG